MKPVPIKATLAAVSLSLLMAGSAQGQDITGRVELTYGSYTAPAGSLAAGLGFGDYGAFSGNARLMWSKRIGDWSAEAHYKLTANSGDGAAFSRAVSAFSMPVQRTYFDWDWTLSDTDELVASHGIDRLWLGYSTPNFVARFGRQALTWGAGTMFHPMDLVAPFSPDTTDTEFKPGVDMFYLQWLMKNGSDLEFITVPRREVAGGPATWNASTVALRYRTDLGDLGANVILAKDHGDLTAGLGLSGSLGGAAWNAELVPTRLADGTVLTSGLANISVATQVFEKTTVLVAEYYHNGFGLAAPGALDSLPTYLSERLALGQVFTTSQNYLGLGLTMELTPLVNLGTSAIINLDDQSYLALANLNWSLGDNSSLSLGAQMPGGSTGTEFGGLSLSGGSAPFATPQSSVFLQFRHYF